MGSRLAQASFTFTGDDLELLSSHLYLLRAGITAVSYHAPLGFMFSSLGVGIYSMDAGPWLTQRVA